MSPHSRLLHARQSLDSARENCPHWDLEEDGDPGAHRCCAAVDDAKHELRNALKAWRREEHAI
jgi:hypothetical protein